MPRRRTYRVKKDDTFFSIAQQQLGDSARASELASANASLNTLSPGQEINLTGGRPAGRGGPGRGRPPGYRPGGGAPGRAGGRPAPPAPPPAPPRRRGRVGRGGQPAPPAPPAAQPWLPPAPSPFDFFRGIGGQEPLVPPAPSPFDFFRDLGGRLQPSSTQPAFQPQTTPGGRPLFPTPNQGGDAQGGIWMPQPGYAPGQGLPYDPNAWTQLPGGGNYYNVPGQEYTSIIDWYDAQGRLPNFIPMPDAQRLELDDLLEEAGWYQDEWGNWINPVTRLGEPETEPGGGGGAPFRRPGRGGGGGGGGEQPDPREYIRPTSTRTGRMAYPGYSNTGRRLDNLNIGLINWRI